MTDTDAAQKKNYAIMRFAKIRSWATLRLVDQHNNRKGEVSENVREGAPEPVERFDEKLGRDFVAGVAAKLDELGIPKQAAEGKILAVEAVTSASRAWFNAATEDEKEEWVDANLDWAKAKFGRGLISAKLHLDEETWHIHFIAVPVVEKAPKRRGRKPKDAERLAARETYNATREKRWTLSYEDVLGGHRERLSKEQDTYHAAVEHLGLKRGEINPEIVEIHLGDELYKQIEEWERGSPRKNITPQHYRKEIKRLREETVKDRESAAASREATERDQRRTTLQRQRLADRLRRSRRRAREQAVQAREHALAGAREEAAAIVEDARRRSEDVDARSAHLDDRAADLDAATVAVQRRALNLDASEQAVQTRGEALERREVSVAGVEAAAGRALAEADALRAAADADRAALAGERAEAEFRDRLTARQIDLVGRAMHVPALALVSDDSERGVTMNRAVMNAGERGAYDGLWSDLSKRIANAVADALGKMRERFNGMIRDLTERMAELDRQRDAHVADVRAFKAQQIAFERDRGQLQQYQRQAAEFVRAWEKIPPAQRSPAVQDVVAKAGIVAQAAMQPPGTDVEIKSNDGGLGLPPAVEPKGRSAGR